MDRHTPAVDETRASDPRLDVALPVIAGLMSAIALVGAVPGAHDVPTGWEGWLLVPTLSALMLLRRRLPVLSLLATVVLVLAYYISGRPPIGLELLIAPAVLSTAERGCLRAAVLLGFSTAAVEYSYRALHASQGMARVLTVPLLTTLTVIVGAAAAGDSLRARRRERYHEQAERQFLIEQHDLRLKQRLAGERRTIARDIHDVLAHTLTVISQQASVALEARSEADRAKSLRLIREFTRSARADLKDSLAMLRETGEGESRQPTPDVALVNDLAERFRAGGQNVGLSVYLRDDSPLPTAVASTAYRIVQEAMTNVAKHAQASTMHVTITQDEHELVLTVSDDGGNRRDWKPGTGLRGMRERAELLGGRIEAGPGPSGGHLRVHLPLTGGGR